MSHFGKSINDNKDSIVILSKGEPGNKIHGDNGPALGGYL